MSEILSCWRCGASLQAITLPLRRLEECPACRAELHVCRMCRAYDPRIARKCREEDAEEVKNKDQANFCDYFKPRAGAFDVALSAAESRARDGLAALFGDAKRTADGPSGNPAEALFQDRPKGAK